jgi:hypothetical protein
MNAKYSFIKLDDIPAYDFTLKMRAAAICSKQEEESSTRQKKCFKCAAAFSLSILLVASLCSGKFRSSWNRGSEWFFNRKFNNSHIQQSEQSFSQYLIA